LLRNPNKLQTEHSSQLLTAQTSSTGRTPLGGVANSSGRVLHISRLLRDVGLLTLGLRITNRRREFFRLTSIQSVIQKLVNRIDDFFWESRAHHGCGQPAGNRIRHCSFARTTIAITSTTERIQERAHELAAAGADVFALPADLRDHARTKALVQEVLPTLDVSTSSSTTLA